MATSFHRTTMRGGKRAAWLMTGASSLLAIALAMPAQAQTQTDLQNNVAPGTAAPQPAVPVTANETSAAQAGSPQDAATAQDVSQGNSVEAGDPDIVVVGLRGSLQRNLDLKRESSGVVDVISAEDIGKFPDSNVAASLQRLPGVSIQRSGSRGEPTGITVRGFGGDFNTTLYDGRRIATGTGNRQIDFSTVGVDFIGQLSVLKTPDVSLASSSIGATVNIAFPNPFDHPGFRAAATASASVQDRAGRVVPTGGLLISTTNADETFGVLADVIYTRRDTDTNRVYVSGWPGGNYAPCQLAGSSGTCTPTTNTQSAAYANPANRQNLPGWFPQQYGAEQQRVKDERVDARVSLQYHPSDDLMLTIDNNFSRQNITQNNYAFGVWFNQGDLRNVTLDANGTATDFTQANTPTDFTAALNKQILQTNQTGLNVKYDATENLTLEGDVAYAKSWLNPGDVIGSANGDIGYGNRLGNVLRFTVDGASNKAFPSISNFGPAGDGSRWADQSLIGSHVTVNQTQHNTDELVQFRGNATWKQDDLTLKAGGQYYQDTFNFRNQSTFVNNFWQAYAGYGGPSGGTSGISPLPANLYQGSISLNNFIPGFNGSLPPSVFVFDPIAYQNFLTSQGNPSATRVPGFNYGNVNGFTGTFDEAVDPGSILRVRERTWSLYASANFKTEVGGLPLTINAGIRNETTSLVSAGQGRLPLGLVTSTADPTLLSIPNYTQVQPQTARNSYSYLLPSMDAKLELTNNLILRIDASRTLTRPTLNLLNPVLNVGNGQRIGALNASGGNAGLKPYLADNFDLGAEWYYRRNSYVAVNFFLKNVSNFIVGGVSRQAINGVVDPTTGQLASFAVSQQVNGPDATVRGVELAWQQVFGDTGFGFQANATFVGTNRPYDDKNISQTGFAVTGLANSANFVGFYDKSGFQIRAALNWRDEYLAQFGQNQNTGSFGAEPTFVNQSFQVDLTSSYDVTKNFSVFGEALNLNKNKQSTHGRYSNQLLDVFDYGRRFTLGARYRF
ncbi:iron complex outermembrane receptor protein [Sphingomonas sp. SORGH_AS802]|uniref:TonB-dependent receptor n=1 Tax=unclassified Sphingomonas TaxID=196159 RepID=UPI0028604AAB|nr:MULTISPECIES: TonB-dependent receptor [unclassified Sphingomonas]MDR6128581.1 iron complex outermembrane receptor protein [Sphingomonas sp. SORGH_AS_0438]MDR6135221.1 iron complex outermembrane receptor protein [Sphingomonas sp. SORGH_AS_0802]